MDTEGYKQLKAYLDANEITLVAVSKTKPVEAIVKVYNTGHRVFGENKVQEMAAKYEQLPKDIQWHQIGHLQTNKVKYIAPFVTLIHSIDSLKILKAIDKEAKKCNRTIDCLLQIHIAREASKFGLGFEEAEEILRSEELKQLNNIRIKGLMGMATYTDDEDTIRKEFKELRTFFKKLQTDSAFISRKNIVLTTLSMGMSGDYRIAVEEGSTMVRMGSSIFGERNYDPVN